MDNRQIYVTRGVSPFFLFFIVFLILKLTKTVDWSWWFVTLPLWIGLAISLIIFIIAFIVIFIILLIYRKEIWKK
jgi:hypothetical protein